MNAAVGFTLAGAQIGLDSILIKPKRFIGPFVAQVTIEEVHHDELEITEHPVEQGAFIADHAYKHPAELTIKAGWSNSPSVSGLGQGLVAGIGGTVTSTQALVQSFLTGNDTSQVRDVYANLLKLQASRVLFDVVTGKRTYKNMLMKSLTITTDRETENSLLITASFKQLIIVRTQLITVTAAAENQADASSTMPVTDSGTKQPVPSTRYTPPAAP